METVNLGQLSDRELLVRIDERTQNLASSVDLISHDLEDFRKHVSDSYTKKAEFLPVRNCVFGFVALVLTAFIGALLLLIVR